MHKACPAVGAALVAFALGGVTATAISATPKLQASKAAPSTPAHSSLTPKSLVMRSHSKVFDVRKLPQIKPGKRERPERPEPFNRNYMPFYGPGQEEAGRARIPSPSVAAPPPIANFAGLDFATWGDGHPPDTNGDIGPTYYIQVINTSIGIFNKSTGVRVAAFTFNTFMSQGTFGNLCDTDNFGDPVVLYDTFEDRWIITDFAFQLDGSGNVINPPGSFQCFAASKTGDPVSGGWNFYSINTTGGLGDYPKFGIWPDGLYMATNMFDYAAAGSFQNVRTYAFNKAQMYAGTTTQVVSFDAPSNEFTMLPSNARLQAGTPPTGTPNYYATVWNSTTTFGVWKFHVDWSSPATSTFTGPFNSTTNAWGSAPRTVPAGTGANNLETLSPRLMAQNQYSNLAGVESLWDGHTVVAATSQAAVRFYQVKVTGGTVEPTATQSGTWSPDTTIHRYMPSVAVDRGGDMAIGYTTSNSSTFPGIKYAGRLSTDALNTISQTEQTLIQGTGGQSGTCGGSTCTRWGDYSAMSLDPDGCTFWYTNEYYTTTGLNFLTRIGSFKFTQCIPLGGGGTIQGTVTATTGGAPISGATVALGARTTTTNGSGVYSFTSIPAGTYPSMTASAPGYGFSTATSIVVTDGATTSQNFSLATAPSSGCLTDTTQADFQGAVAVNKCDFTTSSGNVILAKPTTLDQSNTSLSNTGNTLTTTTWWGQTFTPAVTGTLEKADINLFCSSCTGTAPSLTLSVRATSGGLPTGSDLASTMLPGSSSGAASYFSGTFGSPATLTAGTVYALVVRPAANPSAGTYAATFSSGSPYSGGKRVVSTTSGSTWGTPTGQSRDLGFHTYMKAGFATSGDFTSSVKDANPVTGKTPNWTTLTWTATTPSGTAVRFQAAGSNSLGGPFAFVGPDGTASTFFTSSGASLAQFNGFRYLEYRAYLTGTTSTSPTLNDVTVCFDNVSPTSLSVDDVSANEGNSGTSNFNFTVSLSNSSSDTVTVDYATADGTATAPSDYIATSGTLTYTPGQTSKTVAVSVNGDTASEPDETFTVDLSTPVNATIADDQGVGTIQNDDGGADLSLTKADSPDPVPVGSNLTYTITASNGGPDPATGVTVSDTLPTGPAFVSANASQGSCSGTATVVCALGAVAASGSATVTIVIKPAATDTLSNTATIGADQGDPNTANNSDTATTSVIADANGCTIVGTTGNDTLLGTTGDDVICGLQGDDTLRGLEGNDVLKGNGGNDRMYGGTGDDTFDGGTATDTVLFSEMPLASAVTADLTGSAVVCGGTPCADNVELGHDTFVQLSGVSTTENLSGTKFDDSFTGDAGPNQLSGAGGNDTLTGNGGNDYLIGADGADVLSGGAGKDLIQPGIGADTSVDGGTESDTISYADITTGGGVTVTLSGNGSGTATGGSGSDAFTTIEIEIGSPQADIMTGDTGANTVSGLGGADSISGGDGNDVLSGGAGNDTISGGLGTDTVTYQTDPAGITANLGTGSVTDGYGNTDSLSGVESLIGSNTGADAITGSASNDHLWGFGGNDSISGADGDDYLNGGGGTDTLNGGNGTDTCVNGETLSGCESTAAPVLAQVYSSELYRAKALARAERLVAKSPLGVAGPLS
jgi:uncharacterized repeat protein (TIGR01451 family)